MLENYRKQLDEIDDRIASLYARRMEIVGKIGEIKKKENIALTDADREKKIISRVTKAVPDECKLYLKQVFDAIIETSRAYQRRLINPESELSNKISKALNERKSFPSFGSVACQGVEGAYSELAAEKLFRLPDITYFKTFDGVFQAVEKGLCDYGVLPIENSAVGSVNAVYDLMKKHRFYIVRSLRLKVSHHLLAKNGTSLSDVTEIFSHEQALNQCSVFLEKFPKAKITVCANTAAAAKTVAERNDGHAACIASRDCAELYGLSILDSNIQNADNNFTRFICITKNLSVFNGANRISIMMTLPHEAGSLNKTLNKFSTLGLNLTKLESRPLANSSFEFMFYFDFEGQPDDPEVLNLINELATGSEQFTFLGSYSEII